MRRQRLTLLDVVLKGNWLSLKRIKLDDKQTSMKDFLRYWKASEPLRKIWPFKSKHRLPVIIIGIEYPSHHFASLLQKRNKTSPVEYHIVAFIDDNPWHKKMELFGAKVHPESDLQPLVQKLGVKAIFEIEGERLADPVTDSV